MVVSDTSASSPTPLSPTPLSPTMLRRRTPLPSLHQPHPTPTYHFHHHLILQHHLRFSLITRTFLSHAIQFHHPTAPIHLIHRSLLQLPSRNIHSHHQITVPHPFFSHLTTQVSIRLTSMTLQAFHIHLPRHHRFYVILSTLTCTRSVLT